LIYVKVVEMKNLTNQTNFFHL